MIKEGALVVYRDGPAVVTEKGTKITIRTGSGAERRVREKDVIVLHPGPVRRVSEIGELEGEVEVAWEMLQGDAVSLRELCELAYGEYTPSAAWSGWLLLREGTYFEGVPEAIEARSEQAVEETVRRREERARLEERKHELINRIRAGSIDEEDRPLIGDVEALARGLTESSKTLRDLGMREEPERAHGLLLRLGVWSNRENPYPSRFGVPLSSPANTGGAAESKVDDSERRDLTDLDAFAVDDAWTTAADDAVSFDGTSFWVHVADPAAVVAAGSDLDVEARDRGATLHGPERTVHMLPEELIDRFSLGNGERSPALSFRLTLGEGTNVVLEEIVPSWVNVTRYTYAEADDELGSGAMAGIAEVCRTFRDRRMEHAAPTIELPEVRIHILDSGDIEIEPIHVGPSRELVLESMLMVGRAVAGHAVATSIPMPFSRQDEPDIRDVPDSPASMWSARRKFKRSEHSTYPGAHAGLGLPSYVQVTSPLRRYLDLAAHQQLRATVAGEDPPRDRDDLTGAIAASDIRSAQVKRAEQLSKRHFTLCRLLEHQEWTGEAVVVAQGRTTTVLVPELALEANLASREEFEPDEELQVTVDSIRLPTLECVVIPG